MEKRWKRAERLIAGRLGGQRVPITGRQRGDVPDIQHPHYAIEVKTRQVFPGWIREAMAQAEAAKRDGQKLALSVLHEVGTRHDADLVVLSLRDFVSWMGPIVVADEGVVEG